MKNFLGITPLAPVRLSEIPVVEFADFRTEIIESIGSGLRLMAFYGVQDNDSPASSMLYAVISDDKEGRLYLASAFVSGSFNSLTPACPQAHLFEREIFEQCGIKPEGHPWLKPVRFPLSDRDKTKTVCKDIDFFQVKGEEVHEVAVGPVHAGIIEPGHFRFQCHGEDVFNLEISLGYQHRGIESRLAGGPDKRTVHYMETLSGDTTVGHTLNYCQAVEALSGIAVPVRAQLLRAVALELERIANHVGDLGALANDVAFLPTASFCGRIRGDFLNMTALLCGNRFSRGLLVPGGTGYSLDEEKIKELKKRLIKAEEDTASAVNLLWESSSVMARFEETGAISMADAANIGLVGVAARASGIEIDIRHDFPSGYYQSAGSPVSTAKSGDVFSRAYVRWLEVRQSFIFIKEQLELIRPGEIFIEPKGQKNDSFTVSLTEGWRGEICHCAMTDDKGRFRHYKIIDPSFHNWFGLALAMRNQQISDFPLCNKSFNLSYCGHDL